MRTYYKNVAIHYAGDYAKMREHINKKADVADYAYSGKYISYGDKQYPHVFYQLEDPPYVIFYEGKIELLAGPVIAVVGNRKPSSYSLEITQKLVEIIKARYSIISGLAYGIDVCAHLEAINSATIAVIACGLDCYYPKEHENIQKYLMKHHLVISEYPFGVKPQRHHFPFRNRLIACLGEKVYVMSATERSGTMCTVNEALRLNREVICLPHPINDITGYGCNLLIEQGASLLTNLQNLDNI